MLRCDMTLPPACPSLCYHHNLNYLYYRQYHVKTCLCCFRPDHREIEQGMKKCPRVYCIPTCACCHLIHHSRCTWRTWGKEKWSAIDRKAVKDSYLAGFTLRKQESTFDSLLDWARCVVVNGGNWTTIVLGIRFSLPEIRQKPDSQLPTSRQGYMPAEQKFRLISQQPSSVCLFCTHCEMRD